ncbi:MAG: outer membrane protein assembly factor BamE [Candidatus Malihini olakiniferum]
MHHKMLIFITVVFVIVLTSGCSILNKLVYRLDINQGNYLAPEDVAKIHTGMTKQQVSYILGSPMMQDSFGSDTWFYIFRQQSGHKTVEQQTLTMTFSKDGALTNMKNQPTLN